MSFIKTEASIRSLVHNSNQRWQKKVHSQPKNFLRRQHGTLIPFSTDISYFPFLESARTIITQQLNVPVVFNQVDFRIAQKSRPLLQKSKNVFHRGNGCVLGGGRGAIPPPPPWSSPLLHKQEPWHGGGRENRWVWSGERGWVSFSGRDILVSGDKLVIYCFCYFI